MDFTMVSMDDYKVVLGLDFFRNANAILAPTSNALIVLDGHRIHVVPLKNKKLFETKTMSAL